MFKALEFAPSADGETLFANALTGITLTHVPGGGRWTVCRFGRELRTHSTLDIAKAAANREWRMELNKWVDTSSIEGVAAIMNVATVALRNLGKKPDDSPTNF